MELWIITPLFLISDNIFNEITVSSLKSGTNSPKFKIHPIFLILKYFEINELKIQGL